MPMLIKCCVNNNMHEIISRKRGLPIHATCAAHTLWKMHQSTFKKAFKNINEEKVICYQLKLGKYLANVLTECSSRHWSGRKWRSVKQTLLFIAMHYWGYGLLEVKGQTTTTFNGRSWTMAEDRRFWWRRPCTFRWHLQRSTSTEMEDWKSLVAGPLDEEAGREEQSSPTFDLHWCIFSVVHGYK